MRSDDLDAGMAGHAGFDPGGEPLVLEDPGVVDLDQPPGWTPEDPGADELGVPDGFDPAVPTGIEDLPNFDAQPGAPGVVGDPWSDMQVWHQQESDDTCAVASQEFVLDAVTGVERSEAELVAVATQNGWYQPGGGTPLEDTGKVLEAYGIGVERTYGCSLDDVEAQLAAGQHVIVGVDAQEIWTAGKQMGDDSLDDFPGIPGMDANHAVEIIGIDRSDPANPQVVLNDPGHPDGRGLEVSADEFTDAWADSDHFMMSTTGLPAAPTAEPAAVLGGYHNADGTYHWTWTGEDTPTDTATVEDTGSER